MLFLTALAQRFNFMRVPLSLIGVAGCLLEIARYFVVTYSLPENDSSPWDDRGQADFFSLVS